MKEEELKALHGAPGSRRARACSLRQGSRLTKEAPFCNSVSVVGLDRLIG